MKVKHSLYVRWGFKQGGIPLRVHKRTVRDAVRASSVYGGLVADGIGNLGKGNADLCWHTERRVEGHGTRHVR
jgi:hypothetical protein